METFPHGAWELRRPVMTSWSTALERLPSSKGLLKAQQTIKGLADRIEVINQTSMYDDKVGSADENDDWGNTTADPQVEEEGEDAEPEDTLVNDPPVSFFLAPPLLINLCFKSAIVAVRKNLASVVPIKNTVCDASVVPLPNASAPSSR
jgi:hypothetical protein